MNQLRVHGQVPLMALTATATLRVQQDIRNSLQMCEHPFVMCNGFHRPNLRFSVAHCALPMEAAIRQCLLPMLQGLSTSEALKALSNPNSQTGGISNSSQTGGKFNHSQTGGKFNHSQTGGIIDISRTAGILSDSQIGGNDSQVGCKRKRAAEPPGPVGAPVLVQSTLHNSLNNFPTVQLQAVKKEVHADWTCPACTLCNKGSSSSCVVCDGPRTHDKCKSTEPDAETEGVCCPLCGLDWTIPSGASADFAVSQHMQTECTAKLASPPVRVKAEEHAAMVARVKAEAEAAAEAARVRLEEQAVVAEAARVKVHDQAVICISDDESPPRSGHMGGQAAMDEPAAVRTSVTPAAEIDSRVRHAAKQWSAQVPEQRRSHSDSGGEAALPNFSLGAMQWSDDDSDELTEDCEPATYVALDDDTSDADDEIIEILDERVDDMSAAHFDLIDVETCKREGQQQPQGNLNPQTGVTIVYAPTRREVEAIAALLQTLGVRAGAYHAGLPVAQLRSCHTGFMDSSLQCVVATIAFGLGINKPDVRRVVHWGWPQSLEQYFQEAGGASRPTVAVSVCVDVSGDCHICRAAF